MANNLSNILGRLTADQLATLTFESGFDANLAFSTASYANFVAVTTSPTTIPYVFTVQPTLQAGGSISVGFYNAGASFAFTQAEIDNAMQAMAIWSGIANIGFTLTTGTAASVKFVHFGDVLPSATTTVGGGTYFSPQVAIATSTANLGQTTSGYIALDNKTTVKNSSLLAYGDFTSLTNEAGYGFDVLVHEVGHLVGLGHTGPYNFSTIAAQNVLAPPNQNNPTDVRDWSIMSYVDPNATVAANIGKDAALYNPVVNWGTDPVSRFLRTPLTPMGLDVIAAQRLLGAPTSTLFAGGQIFGFNSNITFTDNLGTVKKVSPYDFSLDANPVLTLFDTGTGNTLDLSGFTTASSVNLNDGTWSSVAGMVDNIFIEWGTKIDTAIGGSVQNSFTANLDSDTIIGGSSGADSLTLLDRRADYAYVNSAGTVTLTDTKAGHYSVNHIRNVGTYNFSDVALSAVALNTVAWTGAISHDFGIAGNWNPANVPANTNDVAIAGTAGTFVQVVQQQTNSFDSLFLAAGNTLDITVGQFNFSGATRASALNGVLQLAAGAQLYFDGNLVNSGTVQIGGNFLADGPTITVSGGGVLALAGGDIASIRDASGSPLQYDAFTNADNTIDGFGTIGAANLTFPIRFTNQALVRADGGAPLYVKGATTNSGTIENTGTSTLDLAGEVQNAGGTILSQSSTGSFALDGTNIHGGRLLATGGGGFVGFGSVTLDNQTSALTLDGNLTMQAGSTLTVLGSLGGSGTIFAAGARLVQSGLKNIGVPVVGSPTVQIAGNGPTIFANATLNATLAAGPDRSVGFVANASGSIFVNPGTLNFAGTAGHGALMLISSNVPGAPASFSGGGTITLGSVDDVIYGLQTNGIPDSFSNLDNTITGLGDFGHGRMHIANGGTIRAAGGVLALNPVVGDSVDNYGSLSAASGAELLVNSALSNSGTVGAASGGTIALLGGVYNSGLLGGGAGGSLVIVGTLDNHGSIGASGANLVILGTLVGNSNVGMTGTTTLGGSFGSVSAAGVLRSAAISATGVVLASHVGGTLDNVHNLGLVSIGPDQTLAVATTLTNSGTIRLAGSFDAAATLDHAAHLLALGSMALSGAGTISMADRGDSIGGGGTLENVDNIVQGQGTIAGLTLVNDSAGKILANAGDLVLDGGNSTLLNFGLIAAAAGNTLDLRGGIVNGSTLLFSPVFINGGIGTIAANGAGALVRLGATTVHNGVLTASAGGQVHVVGSATLSSDANFLIGFGLISGNSADVAVENTTSLFVDTAGTLTLVNGLGNLGTIVVADGGTLAGAGALAGGGTVNLSRTARMIGLGSGNPLRNNDNLITGAGTIVGVSNDGGRMVAAAGTLLVDASAHYFMNDQAGILQATTGVLRVVGDLNNNATLDAAGGSIVVTGSLTGSGVVTIEANGTLTLGSTVYSSQNLTFTGSGGTLEVGAAAAMQAPINGFDIGDALQLDGITGNSVVFNGSTLLVSNAGSLVASLNLYGSYGGKVFSAVSSGGNTSITLAAVAAACYAAGTLIETVAGPVPIERLAVGDRVVSHFGGSVGIVWLGHRTVACRQHPRPWDVWPVRVAAHAFGDQCPARDLYLSPDHAVYLADALIPVRYLINGATVRQIPVDRVTYWHVELPAHDVIMAENLPAESFLDTGNRAAFANGGGARHLHPDFARQVWDAEGCAPLLCEGPVVHAIQAQLLRQAAALGHRRTANPGLVLLADGSALPMRPAVRLPAGTRHVRLQSRSFVPAWLSPGQADGRQLGVAVTEITLDGTPIALTDPRLASGWQTAEAGLRWTDGAAVLDVAGARDLRLTRAAIPVEYWLPRRPICAGDGTVSAPGGWPAKTPRRRTAARLPAAAASSDGPKSAA